MDWIAFHNTGSHLIGVEWHTTTIKMVYNITHIVSFYGDKTSRSNSHHLKVDYHPDKKKKLTSMKQQLTAITILVIHPSIR